MRACTIDINVVLYRSLVKHNRIEYHVLQYLSCYFISSQFIFFFFFSHPYEKNNDPSPSPSSITRYVSTTSNKIHLHISSHIHSFLLPVSRLSTRNCKFIYLYMLHIIILYRIYRKSILCVRVCICVCMFV